MPGGRGDDRRCGDRAHAGDPTGDGARCGGGDRGGTRPSSNCARRGGFVPARLRLDSAPNMRDTPPVDLLGGALKALRDSFRFDHLVALSRERALYQAYDGVLKRPVALRLHLIPDSPRRAWFLRETEPLAALDHPAVRHLYAAGEVEAYAYRTNNWIDGESLADAMHRGSRPVPAVMSLARDLTAGTRSEEHTSELQSHLNLVCRLLLEKKKNN